MKCMMIEISNAHGIYACIYCNGSTMMQELQSSQSPHCTHASITKQRVRTTGTLTLVDLLTCEQHHNTTTVHVLSVGHHACMRMDSELRKQGARDDLALSTGDGCLPSLQSDLSCSIISCIHSLIHNHTCVIVLHNVDARGGVLGTWECANKSNTVSTAGGSFVVAPPLRHVSMR